MKIVLPDYAVKCLDIIEANGFEAWAVGGCVRDALLGLNGGDVDVASSASPEDIKSIFTKVYDTGIKHGTVTVVIDGNPIEVTRFRNDGNYTDSRHPDKVTPVLSIEEDVARRDFTVNAMAYNPKRGLIDLYSGTDDLKSRIIKCVGDPQKRFHEDALRIMRAFRFASKLDFSIEENTLAAAVSMSERLSNVSSERICKELYLTLCGQNPNIIKILIQTGALSRFGITSVNGNLGILRSVPNNEGSVFATLAYLCDADAENMCTALKTSKKVREESVIYQKELNSPLPETRFEIKKRLRITNGLYKNCLLLRGIVLGEDVSDCQEMLSEILKNREAFEINMLDVTGKDIAASGVSGKKIGDTLERLLELVMIDPELNTREKLLSLI
ncbi:MAG: CCA tRNA nucleotidyltransferase [Clostridia bacterium]|nr:CCA tRNA nucleotidyltransferase [Clostridia bacterium]